MLKKYFTKIRQKCWDLIDRKYPENKTKYDLVIKLVKKSINEKQDDEKLVLLDAGCGHNSGISCKSDPGITLVGTDIVYEDIRNNKEIDSGFVSNLDHVPLKDKSIDIIFSNMVYEHLNAPDKFYSELNRILRSGGHVIFSTPCIYNIVVVINRLLPDSVSKKLGSALTDEDDEDIFPAFYRANSIRKIRKLGKTNGFKEVDLIMYQPPPYAFVFSTIICKLAIYYYNKINKYDMLKFLRGVIIARYEKLRDL